MKKRNPVRRLVEARKKSVTERRVAAALAKYLRKQNPGTSLRATRLKGNVLRITKTVGRKRRRR